MLKKIMRFRNKGKFRSSEEYVQFLRDKGATIGEDVHIYAPNQTVIDSTNAYLLSIGNHVRITQDVVILTHDYGWSVLKCGSLEGIQDGAVLGANSAVEIGDCVYIGMKAIILRGVKIGDNVIIGAGSVVTKDCESNSVYVGNPAKRISSIEEYFQKRLERQFMEAKDMALRYEKRYGRRPPKEVFAEYFLLFCDRETAEATPEFRNKMKLLGNLEKTQAYMDTHPPMFSDYAAFLEACFVKNTIKAEDEK